MKLKKSLSYLNPEKETLTLKKEGEPIEILFVMKCQLVIAKNQDGEEVKLHPKSVASYKNGWLVGGDKGIYVSENIIDEFIDKENQ